MILSSISKVNIFGILVKYGHLWSNYSLINWNIEYSCTVASIVLMTFESKYYYLHRWRKQVSLKHIFNKNNLYFGSITLLASTLIYDLCTWSLIFFLSWNFIHFNAVPSDWPYTALKSNKSWQKSLFWLWSRKDNFQEPLFDNISWWKWNFIAGLPDAYLILLTFFFFP